MKKLSRILAIAAVVLALYFALVLSSTYFMAYRFGGFWVPLDEGMKNWRRRHPEEAACKTSDEYYKCLDAWFSDAQSQTK